jgi:NAD(P)-dependent dehydrogenase (short-subunit alcohol dehydrogenase family)
MRNLTDRTAVVTGAGSGIGRATSLLLAQRGCKLALADIQAEGLAETASMVRALGRPVSTHAVDVSDQERMARFPAEVVAAHGGVHLLVNNAGVTVNAAFKDHSLEDFEWLMGINFWGVVYGCKFFLPHLLEASEGHIVNISSMFGLLGIPNQSSYCASKFAVRGFTEALRIELAKTKVGVTSVHPGGIATNIAAASRVADDEATRHAHKAVVRSFKKMVSPDIAAGHIVRGIERNKPRVLITRETHIADLAKRLLPTDLMTQVMVWGHDRYLAKTRSLRST